jgi:NDP-sugar pyrophosphorylase family protein
MDKTLLILGAGGHGRVVKEIAEAMGVFEKIDFLDDNPDCEQSIGLCIDNEKLIGSYNFAIPSFGNNELRLKWIERLKENCFTIPVLIHPTAFISPSVLIYEGAVVEAKAIVNTNSVIDRGCIVSVGAIVDHDTFIGRGCHIDCGAIVNSNCLVKALSKIDSGKVITRNDLPKPEEFLNANKY